jgi:glycosyltransferase involved in cell wall biosynthesis
MDINDFPMVTIVIANKDYGRYLEQAVTSALAQNYPPTRLQVYIYDDASEDDSWQILEDNYFSKMETEELNYSIKSKVCQWGKIKLCAIRGPKPMGPSYSRNMIITSTLNETDIYAILDADDVYHPDKVVKCVNVMMMNDKIGVVYADYDILNVETGNLVREYKQPYDKLVLQNECIVHSGALIKKQALREVFEKTGFYDETMRTCEDFDLWLRISDKYMISHVPESLSIVRVHKNNATYSVKNEVWQQNWHRVREKMIARNA